MIQPAVWLAFCVMLTFIFQARPIVLLSIVLVLRILVPSTAGWIIFGDWAGNSAVHPATALLLIWAPFAIISLREHLVEETRRYPVVYFSLSFVVAYFVLVALIASGPTSLVGLTNSLIAGLVYFLLLRIISRSDSRAFSVLIRFFISLMIFEAILVCFQWFVGENLPWSLVTDFPLTGRPLGTFDSPLDFAFSAAIAIPFLAGVTRAVARYAGVALLLISVVLSASRTPTVLAIVATAYVVVMTVRGPRALVSLITFGSIAAAFVLSSEALSGLAQRFNGADGNSLIARNAAAAYLAENLEKVMFVGNGWGSSYELMGTVLQTSLENGYAILAFDLGGIAVLVLLATQIRMVLSPGSIIGSRMAGVVAIAGGFMYSGLATMSAFSTVTWLVFALCLSGEKAGRRNLHGTSPHELIRR